MNEAARRPADDKESADRRGVCVCCGRPRDPRYAPFCSRRCADVDLYRWLTGAYVIAGAAPGEEDDKGEG
jgi:endogenous inhibitor of DNA gyrase (YacG/DUF329 family)